MAKKLSNINQSNDWYSGEKLHDLLEHYVGDDHINITGALSSIKQLNHYLQQLAHQINTTESLKSQHIIPLNVSALTGELGANTNHWVGLHIFINSISNSVTVKYIDPMGRAISNQIQSIIKQQLVSFSAIKIEHHLLDNSIQYVQQKSTIELSGNIDDCGPMLVYIMTCLTCLVDPIKISSHAESVLLGNFLRDSFEKKTDFKEIYTALKKNAKNTSESIENTVNDNDKDSVTSKEHLKNSEVEQLNSKVRHQFLKEEKSKVAKKIFQEIELDSLTGQIDTLSLENKTVQSSNISSIKIIDDTSQHNEWYTPEKLEQLLTKHVNSNTRVKGCAYSAEQLEAILKELESDDQVTHFIIPLNVNVNTGDFIDQNHWVGLYITREQNSSYKVKYYNPTGKAVNDKIESQLLGQLKCTIESTNITLQYGQERLHSINIVEFQGNTNDCGPFLVYGMICINQGKEFIEVHDLNKSKDLGQKLRTQFINQDNFNNIYANINNIVPQISDKVSKTEALYKKNLEVKPNSNVEQEEVDLGLKDVASVKVVKNLLKIQKSLRSDFIEDSHDQGAAKSALVIGKTGVGKSALVNYLTNPEKMEVKLYKDPTKKYSKGNLVIKVKSCPDSPIIGDNVNATTTTPNKWGMYWDCPGFDDNTGAEQDIANAFFIKKVFDTSKDIKLILVIGWKDFDGNVNELKRLTDTLGNLFNDVDDIMPSLSLVVTKVPHGKTAYDVKGHIERLLSAKCFEQDSSGKKILEFCLDSENMIALFPEIKEETDNLVDSIGGNEQILEVINHAQFVQSPQVNVAISERSQNRVGEMGSMLSDAIDGLIANLTAKYLNHYKDETPNKDHYDRDHLVDIVKLVNIGRQKLAGFINTIKPNPGDNLGEHAKVKIIAAAIEKDFTEQEYEVIKKNINQCIDLFEFCMEIKKDTENLLKTGNFLQHFQNTQDKLDKILDTAEGQLIRIITDEAHDLLRQFIKAAKEDLTTNLPSAIESNNEKMIILYKNSAEVVEELFNMPFTLETLPFFKKSLVAYKLEVNLNALTTHKVLLRDLKPKWIQKYNDALSEFIKPLQEFKSEYDEIVKDIEKEIHSKFEGYFDAFSKEISKDDNHTLKSLENLSQQLSNCVLSLQGINDARPLIEIVLKVWPTNSLLAAEKELEKIEVLQKIGVNISSIDKDKFNSCIKQLETNQLKVDSMYINMYENAIVSYINTWVAKVKDTYDKLSSVQKNELLILLNTSSQSNFFDQISNLGKSIGQKFNDLIPVDEFLTNINTLRHNSEFLSVITQGEKSEKLNKGIIEKLNNKLEDLSTYISCGIASDKAIQDFTESIEIYIKNIDEKHSNIKDIKLNISKLAELFFRVNTLSELSITDSIKIIQHELTNLGDGVQQSLSYLEQIDLNANLNRDNYTKNLSKLHTIANKQISWYENIENIYGVIITKGYLFANHYPTINSLNFVNFLAILQENGLILDKDIDYDDHKAKQLNDLLKHSWQNVPTKSTNSKEIIFSGDCIKISDVEKEIGRSITSVKVTCLNSIVFDSDITAQGVSITVVSPLWYIAQPITINLSGKDAVKHYSKAKDGDGYQIGTQIGSNGSNGLQGDHGENSGNFYGIGYKFIGLGKININLMGGKGGSGQDGGKGGDGQNGLNATIDDFWHDQGIIQDSEWAMRFKFGKMYNRIEKCKGQDGGKGGDGGRGGLGGSCGQNGKLEILDIKEGIKIEETMPMSNLNGKNGLSGKGGQGGQHGNDLKVYYYQNQYTTVRGCEEIKVNDSAIDGYNPHRPSKQTIKKQVVNSQNDFTVQATQELKLLKATFENKKQKQVENDFYYKIQDLVLQDFCELATSVNLSGNDGEFFLETI